MSTIQNGEMGVLEGVLERVVPPKTMANPRPLSHVVISSEFSIFDLLVLHE